MITEKTAQELFFEGNRLLKKGDLVPAQKLFEQALALDPEYADAHNKLGVAFAELGDKQVAKSHFEKTIELDERHASALTNLGNIYFLEGDLAKAEDLHRLAIRYDPENPVPHNNLAAVLKKRGKFGEFIQEVKRSQRLTRVADDDVIRDEYKATPKGAGCVKSLVYVGIALILMAFIIFLSRM